MSLLGWVNEYTMTSALLLSRGLLKAWPSISCVCGNTRAPRMNGMNMSSMARKRKSTDSLEGLYIISVRENVLLQYSDDVLRVRANLDERGLAADTAPARRGDYQSQGLEVVQVFPVPSRAPRALACLAARTL